MGQNTERFERTIARFEERANEKLNPNTNIRYDLVARLAELQIGDIPLKDMIQATRKEFYLSRVWRAKDLFDLALRNSFLGELDYSIQYAICRSFAIKNL